MSTISQRRFSLFVFFFIPGVAMASWVTRTPAIRDRIGASIAEMGFVLLGLSIGSMAGILLSGLLVSRMGTKAVAHIGTWLVAAGIATISAGTWGGEAIIVALGLGLFGMGIGLAEIAINIDGALVEKQSGRPLMHALHGCFSLGTVCGAVVGLIANAVALPVEWHLAVVAVLIAPAILHFIRHIPAGKARETYETVDLQSTDDNALWCDPRLLAIAVIVLAMALAEGAANDWLPILMVDEHGFSPTTGSLVFLFFASAMTVGRFTGGFALERFGRAAVIRTSAFLGAVGLGLVIFSHHPVLAGLSVFLWGIGASLGFPVAISAAGDSGANSTGRVKVVTIGGYIAFLVGPPLLGVIGESYGLRNAMLVVLGLVIAATVVAPAVKSRPPAVSRNR